MPRKKAYHEPIGSTVKDNVHPPKNALARSGDKPSGEQLAELADAMRRLSSSIDGLNIYLTSNPQIATLPEVIKDLNQKLRTLSSRL